MKKAVNKLQEDLSTQKIIAETVSEENRNLKSQIEDLRRSQSGLETKVDEMTNLFQATFGSLTKASIETISDLEKKTRTKKK